MIDRKISSNINTTSNNNDNNNIDKEIIRNIITSFHVVTGLIPYVGAGTNDPEELVVTFCNCFHSVHKNLLTIQQLSRTIGLFIAAVIIIISILV